MQKLMTDYGMILVLAALCVVFSLLTLKRQAPTGQAAAEQLAGEIQSRVAKTDAIIALGAAGAANADTVKLAENVARMLQQDGYEKVQVVVGAPRDLRVALDDLTKKGEPCAAVVTSGDVASWPVIEQIPQLYPTSAQCLVLAPTERIWSDFLKRSNLVAIVDRIVVIAVIAIGMTMVIITGGIDLSVGSLIALSAVIATLVMQKLGGPAASGWAVFVGFLAGMLVCGMLGGIGGWIVAQFKVAPFITTLAFMLMARGSAYLVTHGATIYEVPQSLKWLGQGYSLPGVPNTVLLLAVLYVVAHVFMSHTRLGRYIYAVGGNEEAARLSGVPVGFVIVFVYIVSGLCGGLGGCIQASQINAGTPSIGTMGELYVIAAVVVGGTSLAGGSGRILGTLIGAFIISVIQNGMNLLNIDPYAQQVVLGGVILGAVLLDKVRTGKSVTRFLMSRA